MLDLLTSVKLPEKTICSSKHSAQVTKNVQLCKSYFCIFSLIQILSIWGNHFTAG